MKRVERRVERGGKREEKEERVERRVERGGKREEKEERVERAAPDQLGSPEYKFCGLCCAWRELSSTRTCVVFAVRFAAPIWVPLKLRHVVLIIMLERGQPCKSNG